MNAANAGGGGGGGTARPPKGKWAYYHNEGYKYTVNGKTQYITMDAFKKLPPVSQGRIKSLYHGKEATWGGNWYRVGSARQKQLSSSGRVPVTVAKARKAPPVKPGTPQYQNWVSKGDRDLYHASRGHGPGPRGPLKPGDKGYVKPGPGPDDSKNPGLHPPKDKKPPKSGSTLKKLMSMMGNGNVGQMLPRGYADDLAGMQYDAQIHDLKAQLERQPVQSAQDLADIRSMYGQVGDLNDQAKQHAENLGNREANSIGALGQALMAAGGGSANGANGMLAAATQDSSALLRALGGIDSQYHSEMDPLLQGEKTGALTDQINRGTQDHQNLALQIADLMGQRGQAKTKAIMDIVQANNALAQQRFGNSLSKMQAAAGIQSMEPDLQLKALQLQDQRYKNKADRAAADQAAGQAASGGHIKLSDMNPYMLSQAMSNFMMKPDGTQRSEKAALAYMRAQGYTTHHAQQLLHSQYMS